MPIVNSACRCVRNDVWCGGRGRSLQVKDQQEAERKKMASQEIQQALEAQTKVIAEKQESVRNDLAQAEQAVVDAQQGLYAVQLLP